MGTVVTLRPRSTTTFENEQRVRLKPNAIGDGIVSGLGQPAQLYLGPNSTRLEEGGIVRNRLRGHRPNDLPAVSGGTGIPDTSGEDLHNGAFTVLPGGDPNVPVIFALLFQDANDSVTAGDVTINYDDDTDTARSDQFDIIADGKGPHYTSFPVKSVTSITGANFPTSGAGVPQSNLDTLICGPAVTDAAWDILSSNGQVAFGPFGDPNDNAVDGDAFYLSADDVADQRVYVGFPDIDDDGTGFDFRPVQIDSIVIRWGVKIIGSGSAGIELLFRLGDGDTDWVLGTFTTNGTESGASTLAATSGLTINPKTGVAWTIQDINNIQVGVRFLGESPSIEKRWNFCRLEIQSRQGFLHPTIDGTDPDEQDNAFEVVAKDPFTVPADDATQHIPTDPDSQSQLLRFNFESLPSEATAVNSVEEFIRWTYQSQAGVNTPPINDHACRVGTGDQFGGGVVNQLDGPLEQSNLGGFTLSMDLGGTVSGPRILLGVGDPTGGCGPFGDYPGLDADYGVFREDSLLTTVNGASNEISVANVNAMRVGASLNNRQNTHYKVSRIYADVEYLRDPTGSGSPFFHLVVDDDPDSPDDTNYMPSQHPNDKTFAVDFSGISEAVRVNEATIIARAKTTFAGGGGAGWRVGWITNGTTFWEAVETNDAFENKRFTRALNPVTGLAWTREEINVLQVAWQARGENDYVEKQVSLLALEVDFDEIPDKIDNARDIASRKLRLRRRPIPFFRLKLPIEFVDVGILGDVDVLHRAIPRTEEFIGFERWDKSFMRVFKEVVDLNDGSVTLTLLDLRDFLVTLWITGRTQTQGVANEGMAIMTPGVQLSFVRPTNDYFESPNADFIQELNGDQPPSGPDGILIQNRATNFIVNSHFANGTTDVFDGWQKVGDGAAGASILEDLLDVAFEQFEGAPARSVIFTGADSPSDVYLTQEIDLETGDGLSPEGAFYVMTVEHKDDSGDPLSVSVVGHPVGFADRFWRFQDSTWVSGGGDNWLDLPIRSERTRERVIGFIGNMELLSQTGGNDILAVETKVGVNSIANQVNHLYGVTVEGGTLVANEDTLYPTSRILTKTGPVVREAMQFSVPVRRDKPAYPAELRGTCFAEFVPIWDSTDLPVRTGVRRYFFGLVLNADNEDSCYYDADTEEVVLFRKIAGVSAESRIFYPQVTAGIPIRIAWRWISSLGELGETPFSLQLFVNDIEGPKITSFTQGHNLPSESLLYIGSRDGTDGEMIDALVRDITIKQFALPFDSIKGLP